MAIEINTKDVYAVFSFNSNKFTKIEVEEFTNIFDKAFSEGKYLFIVDLAPIEFMDSSALGIMVNSLKKLPPEGDIRVCSLSQPVLSLFKLTRMDKIFKIYDNLELALI